MEEKSLATEMLQELKASNKRWFIIAIVELIIIVSMVIGYFVYESQFTYEDTEEIYTQETHEIDNSTITQSIE